MVKQCDCVKPAEYGHSSFCPFDEIEELKAEVARLRAALDKYGTHQDWCAVYPENDGDSWECNCGWHEAAFSGETNEHA